MGGGWSTTTKDASNKLQENVNAFADQKDQATVAFAVKKVNKTITPNMLEENKVADVQDGSTNKGVDPVKFASNGGFDPEIWGTMDTSKWQLDRNGNITGYTGDMAHIIIPNSTDFAKVGKNYRQISISSSEMEKLSGRNNRVANTLAISLTNDKKVKAANADWNYTFNGSTLKQANLEGLDTSNVTDMSDMFSGTPGLTNLDISTWNTSNVTDMSSMFDGASNLMSLDVSNWNTSNVTDMHNMFTNAANLTNIGDLSKWNTSKVTDMHWMFYDAIGLTNLDVSKWNTGKVTDMHWMFYNANSLTNLDVSKWNTSNVTDMSDMFWVAGGLTSLDVSEWDTGKVTNMSGMFFGADNLTSLDVSNWDTRSVTDMSAMFDGTSSLTSLDVSNWDTSKVTDMNDMFNGANKLTLITNNPSGWQHATDSGVLYGVPVVITNNANILNATDKGNYTVDGNSNIRSVIFNSSKSPVADNVMSQYEAGMTLEKQKKYASDVVKLYNQKLMQDYEESHPDREISYDPSQDMNDPVALARAKFVTVTKVEDILDTPANHDKLHATATREYIIHNIDGSTTTITQSINYHRTGKHNLVTNKDIFTEWIYNPDETSVVVVATKDKTGKVIASPVTVEGDNCIERDGKAYFGSLKIKPKTGFKLALDKPATTKLNVQAKLASKLLPRQFFVLKAFAPMPPKMTKQVASANSIKPKQDHTSTPIETITSANAIKQGKDVIVKPIVKSIEPNKQTAIHDQAHADSPINGLANSEAQLADVQNISMTNNKQLKSDVNDQRSMQVANLSTENSQKSAQAKSQYPVTQTNNKVKFTKIATKSAASRQNKTALAEKASAKSAINIPANTVQSVPEKTRVIAEKVALMTNSKQNNTSNSLSQTSSANDLGMAALGLIMSSLGITLAGVKNKKHE